MTQPRKSDIPQARQLILQALEHVRSPTATAMLQEALTLMYRSGPASWKHGGTLISEKLRQQIKKRLKEAPHLPQHDIAAEFGVNQGAVSRIARELT